MDDLKKLSKAELIERLELKEQEQSFNVGLNEYDQELQSIDKLATVSNPHRIPFTVTDDHKNVMLYTALNKCVGPLHPDNARRTMIRWKRAGFQLYTNKRTPEQIEAYKKTPQYIKEHEKHLALRRTRHSQSSKGKQEKMIENIAVAVAKANKG